MKPKHQHFFKVLQVIKIQLDLRMTAISPGDWIIVAVEWASEKICNKSFLPMEMKKVKKKERKKEKKQK